MSVRQLEFQLEVQRVLLRRASLDIELTFARVLQDTQVPLTVASLRGLHDRLRVEPQWAEFFEESLRESHPELSRVVGQAITSASRLFHHHELVQGAHVGRTEDFTDLWHHIFQAMVRLVYIHPRMFAGEPRYTLAESVRLIDGILDTLVYHFVPLTLQEAPVGDVLPLTRANLTAQRTIPTPHRPPRHSRSVLSLDSTVDAQSVLSHRLAHLPHSIGDGSAVDMSGILRVNVPNR